MTGKKIGWTQITVRLPELLKEKLDKFAKTKELDSSTIGRLAIREYLDRSKVENE